MSVSPRILARRTFLSVGLLLIFAAGCRREEPTHPEPQEKIAQKTVWSDRFEVFLEHKLIVAGVPTTFATHVTDLRTLEPRSAGAMRFLLRFGADPPLEVSDPEPARPGIYAPKLTFPQAGKWTASLRLQTEGGESAVELGDFTVYASADEARASEVRESPEGITFLKEQQWKLKTKTEAAIKRRLVERLRVSGRVTARPGSRATVTPPLAGRVLPPPDGELPALGSQVKAGQTLALLQPPFSDFLVKLVESEAEVARTGLAVELAELTYSRVQKLADQELKAAREREEADFALRSAKANQQSARAVQAAYQKAGASFVMRDQAPGPTGALPTVELKAPLSGLVTQVAATAGEHVPADRALITILDPEWVHLEARLPEADVDRVATPGGGVYEFPHAPGEFHQLLADGAGRVVYFGPEVDAVTRTVPLIYEVNNASRRLRIGLALNLYLETARAEEALAIPESAVVDEEGRPIAFVQVSGELFDKRYLTLGLREGGFVEVKDGLSAGERVATRGAYAIRLASVSTSIPSHGHPH